VLNNNNKQRLKQTTGIWRVSMQSR